MDGVPLSRAAAADEVPPVKGTSRLHSGQARQAELALALTWVGVWTNGEAFRSLERGHI